MTTHTATVDQESSAERIIQAVITDADRAAKYDDFTKLRDEARAALGPDCDQGTQADRARAYWFGAVRDWSAAPWMAEACASADERRSAADKASRERARAELEAIGYFTDRLAGNAIHAKAIIAAHRDRCAEHRRIHDQTLLAAWLDGPPEPPAEPSSVHHGPKTEGADAMTQDDKTRNESEDAMIERAARAIGEFFDPAGLPWELMPEGTREAWREAAKRGIAAAAAFNDTETQP